jgi:hypothetical protein
MLQRIFRRMQKIKPIALGRWCLNDRSKNNLKVDMANIDHCGTCSYDQPPKTKNVGALVVFKKKEISPPALPKV